MSVNPETTRISLDIMQLIALGGLIWGLARMSKAVDTLKEVSDEAAKVVKAVGDKLSELSGRVLVLEDRTGRRSTDVHR